MEQIRVGFIGDSITHGTGDETLLGWPLRVGQAERARGHDVTVYNLGVRADTSELIAKRWEAECAARLPAVYRCATVFAVGINDSAREESAEREGVRVELERSIGGIIGMIEAAVRFGPSLWVGPTPVVEDMMPLSPFEGVSYHFANRVIDRYSRAYAARAEKEGIGYLDLYSPLSADPDWESCLRKSDGLHPNGEGYQKIAALIGSWKAWRGVLEGGADSG